MVLAIAALLIVVIGSIIASAAIEFAHARRAVRAERRAKLAQRLALVAGYATN